MCRVREANVAERQLLLVVLESSEQFQASASIQLSRRLALATQHVARAACLASGPKPCSCSSRGYDLPACKASKRSIAYCLGLVSSRTCKLRTGGATTLLPRGPRTISSQSCYLDSRSVPSGSQELGRPDCQAAAASERNSTSKGCGTNPAAVPRANSSRTARRPSSP